MASFSASAPRFTEEDEKAELASMSQDERRQIYDDIYGRSCFVETAEQVAEGPGRLLAELGKIPTTEKEALCAALERCPDLVLLDNVLLMFLRSVDHKVDAAARRLAAYWEMRRKVFGEDAYLPLTLEGALANDDEAMQSEFMLLLPRCDESGRAILYSRRENIDFSSFPYKSMIRVVWYLVHAALERTSVCQKGIVILSNSRYSQQSSYDRKYNREMFKAFNECLPVKLQAVHVYHAPGILLFFYPAIKYLMGERLRHRFHLRGASMEEEILSELKAFGIPRACVPDDLVGGLQFDHGAWLTERRDQGF